MLLWQRPPPLNVNFAIEANTTFSMKFSFEQIKANFVLSLNNLLFSE